MKKTGGGGAKAHRSGKRAGLKPSTSSCCLDRILQFGMGMDGTMSCFRAVLHGRSSRSRAITLVSVLGAHQSQRSRGSDTWRATQAEQHASRHGATDSMRTIVSTPGCRVGAFAVELHVFVKPITSQDFQLLTFKDTNFGPLCEGTETYTLRAGMLPTIRQLRLSRVLLRSLRPACQHRDGHQLACERHLNRT